MEAAVFTTRYTAESETRLPMVFGFEVSEKPDDQRTLEWLQSLVDGNIEPITLDPSAMEAYINEEGKILDLPINPCGTIAAHTFRTIAETDYIVGNFVVVGPITSDGETTGASDELIEQMRVFYEMIKASNVAANAQETVWS